MATKLDCDPHTTATNFRLTGSGESTSYSTDETDLEAPETVNPPEILPQNDAVVIGERNPVGDNGVYIHPNNEAGVIPTHLNKCSRIYTSSSSDSEVGRGYKRGEEDNEGEAEFARKRVNSVRSKKSSAINRMKQISFSGHNEADLHSIMETLTGLKTQVDEMNENVKKFTGDNGERESDKVEKRKEPDGVMINNSFDETVMATSPDSDLRREPEGMNSTPPKLDQSARMKAVASQIALNGSVTSVSDQQQFGNLGQCSKEELIATIKMLKNENKELKSGNDKMQAYMDTILLRVAEKCPDILCVDFKM